MDKYKERIFKALEFIDIHCTNLIEERKELEARIQRLEEENSKLKETTQSVILKLDGYIVEMERIRKDYENRNNNN